MASELKYYLEYLERNNKLVIENQLYLDPSTGNFGVGSSGFTYKLTVTGDTYSEQYYMRTPDTGTSNNILIYEGGKIKTKTYTISDGTSGTSGTSGTIGTSGTSGLTGTSGTSGLTGTSGTSGITGTSGTSSITGTSGTSGTSGGTAGYSETSGNSGTSGTSGNIGTSGVSFTSSNGSSGVNWFPDTYHINSSSYNVSIVKGISTFFYTGSTDVDIYLPNASSTAIGTEFTFIKLTGKTLNFQIIADGSSAIETSTNGSSIYCNNDYVNTITLRLVKYSGSGVWSIIFQNGIWILTG